MHDTNMLINVRFFSFPEATGLYFKEISFSELRRLGYTPNSNFTKWTRGDGFVFYGTVKE